MQSAEVFKKSVQNDVSVGLYSTVSTPHILQVSDDAFICKGKRTFSAQLFLLLQTN
jgi:hypothetical protein